MSISTHIYLMSDGLRRARVNWGCHCAILTPQFTPCFSSFYNQPASLSRFRKKTDILPIFRAKNVFLKCDSSALESNGEFISHFPQLSPVPYWLLRPVLLKKFKTKREVFYFSRWKRHFHSVIKKLFWTKKKIKKFVIFCLNRISQRKNLKWKSNINFFKLTFHLYFVILPATTQSNR